MVKIRLARGGSKKTPFYKIVVSDSRSARDGRFIENIGFFNPIFLKKDNNKKLYLQLDRFKYWLSQGAKLSMRVTTLTKQQKKIMDK